MKHIYFIILLLFPVSAQAGENILMPMMGFSNWSDDTGHTAQGVNINFENDNDITFGFKYLYMFDSGFAIGGNAYLYDKDVNTIIQASDAGVLHVHALAEYYFNSSGSVSPYVGAGLGFTAIGFNGGLLDEETTAGESIELNGGILFRVSDTIGINLEYKYTDFDVDEDINGLRTDIDTESHSILVGVSIHL